jgi:hypothetical protein
MSERREREREDEKSQHYRVMAIRMFSWVLGSERATSFGGKLSERINLNELFYAN